MLIFIALALLLEIPAVTGIVFLNALGMGVGNRNKATQFYAKAFGSKKSMTMPVGNMGQGGWTEDIDTFPAGAHSSALVIMAWTDRRNTKNLPIKLTFAVENPKEKQAQISRLGGQALEMTTEANPSAIYAKDLDGYLIELIKGSGQPALKSIGIGVSNLNQSAAWWSGATGLPKGPLRQAKEWDSITLASTKGSQLSFMTWHETPKRPTKNMPIKLVFAASSTAELKRNIQRQTPRGTAAGTIGMFQWEPLE
jgi:predicted enzyme related to lactoylglutathione lyase